MSIGFPVGGGGVTAAESQSIAETVADDYLPLVGGDLSGPLEVTNRFTTDGPGGFTWIFRDDGTVQGSLIYDVVSFKMDYQDTKLTLADDMATLGIPAGTLQLTPTYLETDVALRIPRTPDVDAGGQNLVGASELAASKGYVDFADTALQAALDLLEVDVGIINNLLTADDAALDTLQEIIDRIKANKSELDGLQVADVGGLVPALAAKADTGHGHVIADVTALQSALDAKFNATGGTLTGDLFLNTNTPELLFQTAGVFKGSVKADGTSILIRHLSGNTEGAKISLFSTAITANSPLTAPELGINAANPRFIMQVSGTIRGDIKATATAVQLRQLAGGVQGAAVTLFDNRVFSNVRVECNVPTASGDDPKTLVTKDYVDALEARIAALEAA